MGHTNRQICLTWTSKSQTKSQKTCCFWSRLDSWTESTKTRRAKTQSTFAAGFLRTTSGIISWWMNRCTHLWPNGHTTVRWWLGHHHWMWQNQSCRTKQHWGKKAVFDYRRKANRVESRVTLMIHTGTPSAACVRLSCSACFFPP